MCEFCLCAFVSNCLYDYDCSFEGDFVPKIGDEVSYKRCPIPPKNEKFSAVHVQIVHPVEGVKHERWDSPTQQGQSH